MQTEFPKEYYLKIETDFHKEVRITISKFEEKFNTDIDIVFKETKKIYYHIDSLFNYESEQEAIDNSVQKVSNFFTH